MQYKKLAEVYESLSETSKRLEKIETLSKFLKSLDEKDSDVLYLLLGDIYPEYDERRIGISNQLAIKSISKSTGIPTEKVTKEWKSLGDVGKVAEKLSKGKSQRTLFSHKALTTEKVLENLRKLPELEGKGTIEKKLSLITELLASASPTESLYLVRTLIGDLRIGALESTIREAMAKAFFSLDEKTNATKKIKDAIDKSNDLGSVFKIVKKGHLKNLDKISLEIGKPIKVMLAQKATSIKEGLEKVGKPCAIEYKYDGFRMLIHKKSDKEIMLFTRRLENVTKQFPEVIEFIKKYVKGKDFILDSEAVGYDHKTHVYQPFQFISQRIRRKYDIEKLQTTLPVEVNVFDIIYYNGKSFLNEPFESRTKLLRKILKAKKLKIIPSKQIISSNEKTIKKFYKSALKENQEGIMFKNLKTPYQPGSRVGHMLKLKPEEKDLDLVITGAEYGTGKRSGWLSSFILSCRNSNGKKSEKDFLEVGKVSTGVKEKSSESGAVSYAELTKLLKPLITSEKGKKVSIKPKIVVSVTYQEIQRSLNYESGFALRFPRFTALRSERHHKDVNTLKQVEENFKAQKRNYRYG